MEIQLWQHVLCPLSASTFDSDTRIVNFFCGFNKLIHKFIATYLHVLLKLFIQLFIQKSKCREPGMTCSKPCLSCHFQPVKWKSPGVLTLLGFSDYAWMAVYSSAVRASQRARARVMVSGLELGRSRMDQSMCSKMRVQILCSPLAVRRYSVVWVASWMWR